MIPVDPASVGAAVAAFRLSPVAADFLKRILEPLADEIGQNFVPQALVRRRQRLAARTTEGLMAAGIEPAPVDLKILLPVWQHAALENDEGLSDRWAALLANAANPETPSLVHPSFTGILAQLTPTEARYLDLLRAKQVDKGLGQRVDWIDRDEVYESTDLSAIDAEMAIDSLLRHRLIDREPALRISQESISPTNQRGVGLTPFGYRFLAACEMPAPRKTVSAKND